MKRALLLLAFAVTTFAAPPEKWWDNYQRGVAAVNGRNYKAGADALTNAIAERPTEGTSIRVGNQIVTYTPHFFLGIAKFNLGDVDAALREWRISEEQGAITRTEYYSNLKDWVARAQTEKQRNAQSAASGPKKSADAAISRAVALQADALSAGGDRTESYRNALRKLQQAVGEFHKAGTNITAYKSAENSATQAINLFTAAADEAKKLKATQAARPAPVKPQPQLVQPKPAAPIVQTPPPTPVKSEAQVAAEIAVQTLTRNAKGEDAKEAESLRTQLAAAKTDAEFQRIRKAANDRSEEIAKKIAEANAPKPVLIPRPSNQATQQPSNPRPATPEPRTPVTKKFDKDLRKAYRAFASGDLATAEQVLTRVLGEGAGPEAYVLRGCARYTRAMLSRTPEALLTGALADFKSALAQDRGLKLDPRAFSPKLVAYFEQVRNGR